MSWEDTVDESFLETIEGERPIFDGLFARVDYTVTKDGHTVYECKVGVNDFPNAGEQPGSSQPRGSNRASLLNCCVLALWQGWTIYTRYSEMVEFRDKLENEVRRART